MRPTLGTSVLRSRDDCHTIRGGIEDILKAGASKRARPRMAYLKNTAAFCSVIEMPINGGNPVVTALAWAVVGIPLLIGISITLQKAAVFFK